MNAQLPLGIRLNNPGCARWDGVSQWKGMDGPQVAGEFIRFIAPAWGIRLIALTLHNYETRYGIHTVQGAIGKWSPPTENNTAAYVSAVCNACSVGPNTVLLTLVTPEFIKGIIQHENGVQPYPDATIELGIQLARDEWSDA